MTPKQTSSRKFPRQRYAPAGLWLSAIAVLVGIGVLATKVLTVIGIYAPPPETVKTINNIGIGALAAFLIGLALFALLDPQKTRQFLTGRQARHGSTTLINLFAVIGILFAVNLIVYENPVQMDWTEDKENTLAPETLATLKALPEPVQAIGFFTANYPSQSAEKLLSQYQTSSEGKFSYRIINPDREPGLAARYKINRDGTIVLLMGNRQESITFASEQNLTNALVRLLNPEQRVIYFLSGHGEHTVEQGGDTSYRRVRTLLEAKNYTVRSLNLRAENQIPSDATAIVIAGPNTLLSNEEAGLLRTYLDQGGSIVFLLNPTLVTNRGNEADAFQAYLAENWGVVFNNDLIIDPSSNPISVAVAYRYGLHPITQQIPQTLLTFFPVARSLTIASPNAQISTTALVETIDRAWGETDFESLNNNSFNYQAGQDTPGPLTIAAALENTSTGSRLVVFGNSSFATDPYVNQYGNADLIINAIDWAAKQDNLINLTYTEKTTRTLLPISTLGWLGLGLLFILIIPGLIIGAGITAWLIRRAKG